MQLYILTDEAEQDLREIARYTLQKWGKKQLENYRKELKKQFETIGSNAVIKRQFSPTIPEVLYTKAGSHFVFYLQPKQGKPMIVAILHEARDIMQHLNSRLE